MKLIFLLFALVAGLSFFVACGGDQSNNNTQSAQTDEVTSTETPTDDQLRSLVVGTWDQPTMDGPFVYHADGTYELYIIHEQADEEQFDHGRWRIEEGRLYHDSEVSDAYEMDYPLYFMDDYMLLRILPTSDDLAAEGVNNNLEFFAKKGFKKRK